MALALLQKKAESGEPHLTVGQALCGGMGSSAVQGLSPVTAKGN